MTMDSNFLINTIMGMMLSKVVVPSDFHSQVEAIETLLQDDVSGLVDSLTDFSVTSASVDFSIETKSDKLTEILKKWLNTINKDYKGKIPSGIKPLAKEYFKERWKYSSFPVLKISKWANIDGILVPTKMFFVDGGCIQAKDKEEGSELKLLSYDYYLGDSSNEDNLLDTDVIFAKTSGRWFDKYPVPYLIKRGVYHNWKIIESLKNHETQLLSQIIPYLLNIVKGGYYGNNLKTYSDGELKKVVEQFQDLMTNIKTSNLGDTNSKTPTRVTNFDEEIKHLIPDLSSMFDVKLFASAERNTLSGLGYIDIISGISDSRKESVLNPKIFIEEVRDGVEDFKQILKQLIFLIQDKNKTNTKYMNSEFFITSSPIRAFMDDKFRNQLRLLWERGQLSNQTYCEIVGEVEYRTEISRREKEAKNGEEYTMYPHLTKNEEAKGIDITGEEPIEKEEDKNGNPIDRDKIDDKEKYDVGSSKTITKCSHCGNIFDYLSEPEAGMGWVKCPKCSKSVTQKDLIEDCNIGKKKLEGAPYTTITQLPENVKKKLSPSQQKKWLSIFNNAYNYMFKKTRDKKKAESYAFRIAWSQVRS